MDRFEDLLKSIGNVPAPRAPPAPEQPQEPTPARDVEAHLARAAEDAASAASLQRMAAEISWLEGVQPRFVGLSHLFLDLN